MDNKFQQFKDKFIDWSIQNVEIKKPDGWLVCPYAKSARISNSIQFIDARNDLVKAIQSYDTQYQIGIAWLGDSVSNQERQSIRKILASDAIDESIVCLLSAPDSRSTTVMAVSYYVILHSKSDFLKKRRYLFEQGYYENYDDIVMKEQVLKQFGDVKKIYPVTTIKNQAIGSQGIKRMVKDFVSFPADICDIGGNAGNLLDIGVPNIKKYTSIDVSAEAIELGKQIHPYASFIHYDKKNYMYNFDGGDQKLPLTDSYDNMVVNSVFTSTDYNDMIDMLDSLTKHVNDKILFTVFDKNNSTMLEKLHSSIGKDKEFHKTWPQSTDHIYYLFNGTVEIRNEITVTDEMLGNPDHCDNFVTAYDIDWLREKLQRFYGDKFIVHMPLLDYEENFQLFVLEKKKKLTINNSWYLNLDEHLPLDSIPDIRDAIVDDYENIAQNCYGPTYYMNGTRVNDTNSVKDLPVVNSSGNKKFFELEIKYGVRAPFWVMNLTENHNPELTVHDSLVTPNEDWERIQWKKNISPLWQPLIDWIDNLDAFEKRGRVGVFLDRPGVHSHYNNDSGEKYEDGFYSYPHRQEFIWVNLSPEKRFFVLDENNMPIHIASRSAFWNHHNNHGRHESLQHWTFSFKVEGVFSEKFRNRVGISHIKNYYYEE
jgi:hypothetical protein